MSTIEPKKTVLKIAALPGDGIGPEIVREAIKVLRAVEKKFELALEIAEAPIGWAAIAHVASSPAAANVRKVSTSQMGDAIAEAIL